MPPASGEGQQDAAAECNESNRAEEAGDGCGDKEEGDEEDQGEAANWPQKGSSYRLRTSMHAAI